MHSLNDRDYRTISIFILRRSYNFSLSWKCSNIFLFFFFFCCTRSRIILRWDYMGRCEDHDEIRWNLISEIVDCARTERIQMAVVFRGVLGHLTKSLCLTVQQDGAERPSKSCTNLRFENDRRPYDEIRRTKSDVLRVLSAQTGAKKLRAINIFFFLYHYNIIQFISMRFPTCRYLISTVFI